MYWDEKYECMPEEELKQLQLQYLKEVTAWVYERVPAYKSKFDEKGVAPADIKSLDDIVKLPFTIKNDLRDNYPFGFLAVPMNDVYRIHASSGTTGKSTTTAYTNEDMGQWGECVARTIWAPGIRPGDMVQVAFGYLKTPRSKGLEQDSSLQKDQSGMRKADICCSATYLETE